MSVFHPYNVQTPEGKYQSVFLVNTLNISRFPEARGQILDGSFQSFSLESGLNIRVHRPFVYVDTSRDSFFYVLPQADRYQWKEQSERVYKVIDEVLPNEVADASSTHIRVVFGLDELREKLIAQDHGLDDHELELMKVLLLYEHPFLLQRSRMNLYLDEFNEDELVFVVTFDHDKQRLKATISNELYQSLIGSAGVFQTLATNHSKNIFNAGDDKDYWINHKRWSTSLRALNRLTSYEQQIKAGTAINMDESRFKWMIKRLPKGNKLPPWAKRALRTLQQYANEQGRSDIEDKLFETRFEIDLDVDWGTNQEPDDIDTIWNLLKNLPDTNVEGNTKISEILLLRNEGGGWYDPNNYQIAIGEDELDDKERFEDIVRHEVGHAVHEQNKVTIDNWLETEFGWQEFEANNGSIDQWINLMEGWGNISERHRSEIRSMIRQALGSEVWKHGTIPKPVGNHPWNNTDFGPRIALEKCIGNSARSYWWNNHDDWYQTAGKAFSYNFYYKKLMVVNTETVSLIAELPNDYAAMSPPEFFAELYAVYYDTEDDSSYLSNQITQWLDTNVGLPENNGA